MEWGKHLEGFFEATPIHPESSDSNSFFAENEALLALRRWLSNDDSCFRYIRYAASMILKDSPSALLAGHVVSILNSQGLPVASYFCAGSVDEESSHGSEQESPTIRMVYALIWQVLNNLPVELASEDAEVFSARRFSDLQGGTASFDAALTLLDDLLRRTHLTLFFLVIDGLHWIEDLEENPDDTPDQQRMLKRFVQVLQKHRDRCRSSEGSSETFKVLFTSSGSSTILMETLDEDEIVFVGQRPSNRRPGRPSAGTQPLGWLSNF
jgi:hypothetical protein